MISLPKLPYAYNALEPVISKEAMEIHFEKHHCGYVNNLNSAIQDTELEKETCVFSLLNNLFKLSSEKFIIAKNNLGGHLNHELFWKYMKINLKEKLTPSGYFISEIKKIWITFENFENDFKEKALSLFGSGWVWLIYNKNSKILEIKKYNNQDTPYYDKFIPILGIDLWEHSYYLDYKNLRLKYIESWWNIIAWDFVEKSYFDALKKI